MPGIFLGPSLLPVVAETAAQNNTTVCHKSDQLPFGLGPVCAKTRRQVFKFECPPAHALWLHATCTPSLRGMLHCMHHGGLSGMAPVVRPMGPRWPVGQAGRAGPCQPPPKPRAAPGGSTVAKSKPPRWQQTSMGARPQPHAALEPKPARLWCNVNRPPRALQKHRPPVGPHTLRARAHCETNQKKFKHGLR